jgi:hypothetical protein
MNGSMEHQSAGTLHNGLDGAFVNAFLVMRTDTTELEALSFLVQLARELGRIVSTIITLIA